MAIFAIALSAIAVLILGIATFFYRRKSSRAPRYTMRFNDRTISFESTLYNAHSDTVAFAEDIKH